MNTHAVPRWLKILATPLTVATLIFASLILAFDQDVELFFSYDKSDYLQWHFFRISASFPVDLSVGHVSLPTPPQGVIFILRWLVPTYQI